jgi:putative sporulation protein YyaC
LNSNNKLYYFNSNTQTSSNSLGNALSTLLSIHGHSGKDLIFLCIGSDRATGDCLGPIIGHKLMNFSSKHIHIYGTLKNPVHAKNLKDTVFYIKKHHKNSCIIAIDASLGIPEHIGYITLGAGSLIPGLGVHKSLPPIGDIFITGIVNLSGQSDQMLIHTTRLATVMTLAETITAGIQQTLTCQRMNYGALFSII